MIGTLDAGDVFESETLQQYATDLRAQSIEAVHHSPVPIVVVR
jgi:hypothetical protein